MTNVPSGKLLRISAILYMVHRWSLPHTSLQNVFRRDSESSKELQIRIILRTVIMYMYLSQINAFDKLEFEAEFQKLSPGGAISYIEVPDMQQNIPAVLSVMQFIYEHIMYAELNTKSDYCEMLWL